MALFENYNSKKRRSFKKVRAPSRCPTSQDRTDIPSMAYILFLFASLSPLLPGPLIWSSREAAPMTRPRLILWGSLVLSNLPQVSIYPSFSQSLCSVCFRLLCCLGMLVPEPRLCKPLAKALIQAPHPPTLDAPTSLPNLPFHLLQGTREQPNHRKQRLSFLCTLSSSSIPLTLHTFPSPCP